MDTITRRTAIGAVSASAAGLALPLTTATARAGESASAIAAYSALHEPKPLRFDPASLSGLSERLISSHWQNNYQGSVKALNLVEKRLAAALADPEFPPLIFGDLKREELHRTGSVALHELYFDGLGGDGRPGGTLEAALAQAFGSFDAWETDFRRTAMSLAGGSGWCVLAWNAHTRSLHNYWAWDHMHAAVSGLPVIALDMYEHAYHMDYGAAAAKYVDAFMANLDWEVAEARFAAAAARQGKVPGGL